MKSCLRILFYSTLLISLLAINKALLSEDKDAHVRIKDIVNIQGVRSNPLNGIGLVTGLSGTGDSQASIATNKATADLITRLGIKVDQNQIITKNIAIVAVTAELPPTAKIGDKIDIRLSSLGDATSLEGGTLLLTALKASNDHVYAIAQGPISQGQNIVEGNDRNTQNQKTAPKTIALSKSATIEDEFPTKFLNNRKMELSLKHPDFTTAARVTKAINNHFNDFLAEAKSSGHISVKLPDFLSKSNKSYTPISFISELEQIKIAPDNKAIVIINERTGTIIAGQNVVIDPVAISHGSDLSVQVGSNKKLLGELPSITTVSDLVKALNKFGVSPKDLSAILQTLDASKALKAELIIM